MPDNDWLRAMKVLGIFHPSRCLLEPLGSHPLLSSVPVGLQKLSELFNESSISPIVTKGLRELEKTEYYKKYNNLLILLCLFYRVDGRLELCVSQKNRPAKPGNPFWGSESPQGGGSAQFSSSQQSCILWHRYPRMLELGSGSSKPRRHQPAVHHCSHHSDWVVQTKSLQEKRVNSSLKSSVWKSATPVAMSTGRLPFPQPTGGWRYLGSSSGGRRRRASQSPGWTG